jgi:hypothetical protein
VIGDNAATVNGPNPEPAENHRLTANFEREMNESDIEQGSVSCSHRRIAHRPFRMLRGTSK